MTNRESNINGRNYIDEFVDRLRKQIYIEDEELVHIVLSTAAAKLLKGGPLWLLLVGAPGSGKTTLLSLFTKSDHSITLSKISNRSLLSGHDKVLAGDDTLDKMKDKLVVIKDIAPIMSSGSTTSEVLADLRDAYDGHVVKAWGTTVGTKEWRGRFGLIIASTGSIDRDWGKFAELGERFIRVDTLIKNRKALAKAANARTADTGNMVAALEAMGREFFDYYSGKVDRVPSISDEVRDLLVMLANVTTHLRSPVSRDRYKKLVVIPEIEVGTRLAIQLELLVTSMAFLDERPTVELVAGYRLALRVAVDSIPKMRTLILRAILMGQTREADIIRGLLLPKTTLHYELEDLIAIRVLKQRENSNEYQISDPVLEEMRKTGMAKYLSRDNTSPLVA